MDKREAFALLDVSIHLADGAEATLLAAKEARQKASQSPRLREGRLVGLVRARKPEDLHADMWERHPAGDELLVLISGALDLVLDEEGGEPIVELRPGMGFVVPKGIWHRFVMREPSELLYVTRGKGTELRAV